MPPRRRVNLSSTVMFPTRICNNSYSLIDNIYSNTKRHNFLITPLINGLTDHDGQIIDLAYTPNTPNRVFSLSRKTNSDSISKFTNLLSYENWDDVFADNVNVLFNKFHNNYLRIFNACFPILKRTHYKTFKPWLTTGIRISCANKRKMHEIYRISNDINFKSYYKKYCKILFSVILTAQKIHFDKRLLKSTNRKKTT